MSVNNETHNVLNLYYVIILSRGNVKKEINKLEDKTEETRNEKKEKWLRKPKNCVLSK